MMTKTGKWKTTKELDAILKPREKYSKHVATKTKFKECNKSETRIVKDTSEE
jgi:hypothetical protein